VFIKLSGLRNMHSESNIEKTIFWGSCIALLLVAVPIFVAPDSSNSILNTLNQNIENNFSYFYTWMAILVIGVSLWIIISKVGRIKLGKTSPEFTLFSWASMLFCAGVATGILYWGTIEWAYYINTPPFGIAAGSSEAYEWAATYGMFHWGIAGWAFYVIPAVAVGHAFYNVGFKEMRISTACKGVLGKYADGPIGKAIDIFFMIGLLGSSGTSLGLGTPMVVNGINELLGTGTSFEINLVVILLCACIFATSVYLGITKGIKRLSNLNVSLAFIFLAFVLIVGPTIFILKSTTNSVGLMFQNFIRMISWTDPISQTSFVEDWSVFYWSWWIAVGPFMGIFIARISKGRTLRQIALGTLLFGSAGCALFYGILGNYAMSTQLSGLVNSSELVKQGKAPEAIIDVISSLPSGNLGIAFFCVMSIIFMATSFDSTSYVLATTSSKNYNKEPKKKLRLFWAFFLILLPAGLMYIGGLDSLKTTVLISALPLIIVYIFMIISLYKWTKKSVYGN
jgi:BCCT family betaine/carnitine transporter